MSVPTQERPKARPATPSDARGRKSGTVLGVIAVVGVVALTLVLALTGAFGTRTTVVTRTVTVPAIPAGPVSGLDAAALFASANAGVVDITAHSTTTTTSGPFGLPRKAQQTDSGTGIVLDTRGHVLTAHHVVAGATSMTVRFHDGATRAAKLRGGDTASDVAVLKVDPTGLTLHPLALGTLKSHRVGDPVAVIGDPFNVQRSLSTGVISGLDRTIEAPNGFSIPHALQTDAAMNPGNSGGPVLDASGRVVGIADQIATGNSGSDSSTGVGFAVSIDVVKPELDKLKAGVTPTHAYFGAGTGDATGTNGATGAVVLTIKSDGPAARAGLRVGDRITAFGDTSVKSSNDLVAATASYRPGDHVPVTVVRGSGRLMLDVTLAEQPASPAGGG